MEIIDVYDDIIITILKIELTLLGNKVEDIFDKNIK